jgi:translation initiation factor 1 (eIF-1/SUI1)
VFLPWSKDRKKEKIFRHHCFSPVHHNIINMLARFFTTSARPLKVSTLPYYVRRTKSKQLPVYTDRRNGGTRHTTIIRRVDGDAKALAKELMVALKEPNITVKPLNNHVIIKGRRTIDVCNFLMEKGF